MRQFLQSLLAGLIGTIVGCVMTWWLMTRAERNRTRRDSLVRVAKAL